MSFEFIPQHGYYPRWRGPYSPARGTKTGFRFSYRLFGSWLSEDVGLEFWPVRRSRGVEQLERSVLKRWRGGRVLLLPNGFAIKPLRDEDVGKRVLLGLWSGQVVLHMADGGLFNLAKPPVECPGDVWRGPDHLGLECRLHSADGSLLCKWTHPTREGALTVEANLRGADRKLAAGFRACRPGEAAGRVRITANGHVITKRQQSDGAWVALYVGYVPQEDWGDWSHWIMGGLQ